jgi:hypothetical protein
LLIALLKPTRISGKYHQHFTVRALPIALHIVLLFYFRTFLPERKEEMSRGGTARRFDEEQISDLEKQQTVMLII